MSFVKQLILKIGNKVIKKEFPWLSLKSFNTKKSETDLRDYKPTFLKEIYNIKTTDKLACFSIPKYLLPPIRQQKTIGSCASHAAVRLIEINMLIKQNFLEASEMFHYYVSRENDKLLPEDSGMTIRTACNTLLKNGVSPEYLCPYDTLKYNQKPSWISYFAARYFRIKQYERMYSLDDIKKSISEMNPVMCGMNLTNSFINLSKNKFMWKPTTTEKIIGGHAVTIIGFDNTENKFIFNNSWGTDWGNNGNFEMKYNTFQKYYFDAFRIII